jgi:probable HAF family extracellular repeat protein
MHLDLEELESRCLLTYTVTDLGTFGGTQSFAHAINNRGQVVGTAALPCNCVGDAFLWTDGVLHDIGGNQSDANGINDLGQVVGDFLGDGGYHPFFWSRDSGFGDFGFVGGAGRINNKTQIAVSMPVGPYGAIHGFFWTNGRMLDVGNLNGDEYNNTGASDINNKGQMVGTTFAGCVLHGYIWSAMTGMADLGTLGGDPCNSSGATAINDSGQIVGYSYSKAFNTTHAVFYSAQGVVDLGSLGGYSEADAINDAGQVVGQYASGLYFHAFLTDLTTMHMVKLNDLIPPDSGWNLFEASGINDAGQIVGTGQLPGVDIIHAYLLTPDPPLAGMLMQTLATGYEAGAIALVPSSADWRLLAPFRSVQDFQTGAESRNVSQAACTVQAIPVFLPWTSSPAPAEGWGDPLLDSLIPD